MTNNKDNNTSTLFKKSAPLFIKPSFNQGPIDLSNYQGKKVWLAFFRYAACPLCNLRIHEMKNKYEQLKERGIEIIAVFHSDHESISKYVGKNDLPFPLIGDPDLELYRLYHVGRSITGFFSANTYKNLFRAFKKGLMPGIPDGPLDTIPADFLINEQGQIIKEFHGDDISDHIPFSEVLIF